MITLRIKIDGKYIVMNSVLIVLPILTLLMFELGLTVKVSDFTRLVRRPRPVIVALIGQIAVLPAIAFALAAVFNLPPVLYVGLILVACCPGGSSSNVFSMLAKGDVALSVSLTAMNSIITLFTLPVIMTWAIKTAGADTSAIINLPVGNLLVQNIVLMFIPILLGAFVRRRWENTALKIDRVLSKIAFPALMFLAAMFFVQHRQTICDNIGVLGLCVVLLIVIASACAAVMSRVCVLTSRERRTVVIEVGMQNAAQAIAVASSPFIFNNGAIAIPAIVYALMMNVVLLLYVGAIVYFKR